MYRHSLLSNPIDLSMKYLKWNEKIHDRSLFLFVTGTATRGSVGRAACVTHLSFCFEKTLYRTSHRCFLPNFGSFGYSVSEEKIFLEITRKKNCLWWPCLLTDRDEMSNLYRGPSIDASYQVLVHLAKWQSVLLVEETGVLRENKRPVANNWQTLSHNVVSSTPRHERGSSSQLKWWWALIAQVVVNPTTIRSRPRWPPLKQDFWSSSHISEMVKAQTNLLL